MSAVGPFEIGQKKIAVTGTAVQLNSSSVPLGNGVLVQASPDNAAAVVIGNSDVDDAADGTGNGKVLVPGQSWAFVVDDINRLWVNGTADDWVDWSAN